MSDSNNVVAVKQENSVFVPSVDEAIGQEVGIFAQTLNSVYCSLVPKTEEERQLRYHASTASDGKLMQRANIPMRIRHVYAERVQKTDDKTGEVIPLIRVAVITDEGKVYDCTSNGIRKCIAKMIESWGMPPWGPEGIPCMVTITQPKPDRLWPQLVIVSQPRQTEEKAATKRERV